MTVWPLNYNTFKLYGASFQLLNNELQIICTGQVILCQAFRIFFCVKAHIFFLMAFLPTDTDLKINS